MPDYLLAFLSDALTAKESLLCLGRKNAKSCAVAVLLLGLLVGPVRVPGTRVGVASISKEKAGELKAQMQSIAEASALDDLTFYRSPSPGRVISSTGSVDLLASECGGHSSSYDFAVFDELGLVGESQREFVASLRSSTSAKNGKFIALSILGNLDRSFLKSWRGAMIRACLFICSKRTRTRRPEMKRNGTKQILGLV